MKKIIEITKTMYVAAPSPRRVDGFSLIELTRLGTCCNLHMFT